VTDRRSLPGSSRDVYDVLGEKIAATIAAGIDWVQIREKDASAKRIASLIARSTVASTSSASPRTPASGERSIGTRLILNDRLDVALAEGLGGVHLGELGLPVHEAKQLATRIAAERDFLVGASCHSLEAASAAARDGADYIFFGPVFATPSKAVFGAPQGLRCLAEVCAAISIPVLAIGGITLENAQFCLHAGASGIAAIRLFQDASDVAGRINAVHALEY
jgi:thiamine-phosphate pyrophosphorylase